MIGDLVGIADAAEEDRVVGTQRVEGIVGHHLADLEVPVAAPVESVEGEPEAILLGCRFPDSCRLIADFGSDAIAGDHCYSVVVHASSHRFACLLIDPTGHADTTRRMIGARSTMTSLRVRTDR